jgi:hypothetical protein
VVVRFDEISGSHGDESEDGSFLDVAPCSLSETDRRFRVRTTSITTAIALIKTVKNREKARKRNFDLNCGVSSSISKVL